MIGIYLLKKNGRVIYVGQSKNIEMRVSQHRCEFDDYEAIPVLDVKLLDSEEKKYIRKYQPELNKQLFGQPDKPYFRPVVKLDFTKTPDVLEKLNEFSREEGYTNVTHYVMSIVDHHCRKHI